MAICHPRSIEIMKRFLGSIGCRHLHRCLDVAGGDGRFAKGFLMESYNKVDLFDQCPKAVKIAD